MPSLRALRALAAAAAVVTSIAIASPTAEAATPTSGSSTTVSVTAGIRSVSVSTTAVVLSECSIWYSGTYTQTGSTLDFPDGGCLSPTPVTITNGPVAGHIDVSTTNATSESGAIPWKPCGAAAVQCAGGLFTPGMDQFMISMATAHSGGYAYAVGTNAACDHTFDTSAAGTSAPACTAGPGQAATEWFDLHGPSASSIPNTSWTFTVTWTAVP